MRMAGYKLTEEHKRKISKGLRGHKLSKASRKKLSKSMKGLEAGENHPRWNGGMYVYCHETARKLFGSPQCEDCHISLRQYAATHKHKQFNMHCISGDYKIMEQWNWRCLCSRCHKKEHQEIGGGP